MPEDRDLVAECLRGDEAAWRAFVERFGPAIRAGATAALRRGRTPSPREEAREIEASLFAELLENDRALLRRCDGTAPAAAWLWMLAHQRARRSMGARGIRPEPPAPEPPPSPAEEAARAEEIARLRDRIATLPPRERLLVRLRYEDGLDLATAARVAGVREGHAAVLLHRAREKLRDSV